MPCLNFQIAKAEEVKVGNSPSLLSCGLTEQTHLGLSKRTFTHLDLKKMILYAGTHNHGGRQAKKHTGFAQFAIYPREHKVAYPYVFTTP